MNEENKPQLERTRGVVRSCEKIWSANQKKHYQKIILEEDDEPFFFWNDDGFTVGDIIEFEYEIKPFNGKDYFNIKRIIEGNFAKPSKPEMDRLQKVIDAPLKDELHKMMMENDRLNREVTLIKCAFDYGTPRNMTYEDIIKMVSTLRELMLKGEIERRAA